MVAAVERAEGTHQTKAGLIGVAVAAVALGITAVRVVVAVVRAVRGQALPAVQVAPAGKEIQGVRVAVEVLRVVMVAQLAAQTHALVAPVGLPGTTSSATHL